MESPPPERIAKLLADIAEKQVELRRYGAAVYGLQPNQMTLLCAAAAGKAVPKDALLKAVAAGERLHSKLGWDAFIALSRQLYEERHGPGTYPFGRR